MSRLSVEYAKGTGAVATLVLTPSSELHRSQARGLPGARSKDDGTVHFAPDPLTVKHLQGVLSEVEMDAQVAAWIASYHQGRQQAIAAAHAADAHLLHPNAAHFRPYQRTGAATLAQQKRFILADEVGLGKTAQALLACSEVGAKNVLIVTISVVKSQWWSETLRWLGTEAVVVEGNLQERQALVSSNPPWMIVHYELLRSITPTIRKSKKEVEEALVSDSILDAVTYRRTRSITEIVPATYPELLKRKWDVLILDEAQKIQNRHAQQSKAAKRLAAKTPYVFELTGTPLWNMPPSIWHLLHVLYPQRFRSYWQFVEHFCLIEETPWARKVVGPDPRRKEEFQELLAEYLLQRRQVDVRADLPPKIYTTLHYTLSVHQRDSYLSLKRNLYLPQEDSMRYFSNVASMLSTLRTLCSMPHALGIKGPSPKDEALLELVQTKLEEVPKIAIMCWHIDYANHLKLLLEKAGISVITATGELAAEKRMGAIQTFKDTDTQVLVGTIAAMGTGLNLDVVRIVIFAELDWTPAMIEQAVGRFYRFTTTHSVTIYYLIGRNTIEEHIAGVIAQKEGIASELLAMQEVVKRILATPI